MPLLQTPLFAKFFAYHSYGKQGGVRSPLFCTPCTSITASFSLHDMKRFELLLHYLAIGTLEPGAPCSVGTGHRLYVPSGASWHTLTKRRRALPSFTGGSAFLEVLWRRKLA